MTGTEDWRSPTAVMRMIDEHLSRYPAMEPRDAYKLLYQAIMGLGHLVRSADDFAKHLRIEYDSVSCDSAEPLWETVRADGALGRLNLRPFKARGGDLASLIAVCLKTAEQKWGTPEDLRFLWAALVESCQVGQWQAFPPSEMLAFTAWLEERSFPVVHHSARYAEAYRPAYRLVDSKLLQTLEIPQE